MTAEEFAEELEKMKTRSVERLYYTKGDSSSIAEKVEGYMLIYRTMGHERDCSALELVELEKYDYGYSEKQPIELREMHGSGDYIILCHGATKSDVIEQYKTQERHQEKSPRTGELKRTCDVTPEQFQETFGFSRRRIWNMG